MMFCDYIANIMKKTKHIKQFEHIGSLAEKVLGELKISMGKNFMEVWSNWEGAVGPAIDENTRPVALKHKLLMVHVADSTWLQELQFLKADIVQSINELLEDQVVEDIQFKIGPV